MEYILSPMRSFFLGKGVRCEVNDFINEHLRKNLEIDGEGSEG